MSRSPASQREKKRLALLIAGLAIGVIAVFIVVSQTMGEQDDSSASPGAIVARLDELAAAGQWDQVDALIDYESKGKAMVPDLWEASDAEGREAMVGLLRTMFRSSWERYHSMSAFQSGYETTETMTGADTATVEQVATASEGQEIAMIYRLEKRDGHWLIVDRTYRRGTVVNSTELFVKSLRSNIAKELGRPPTLKEFAVNAPSWSGRLRSRFITVPGAQ